MSLNPADEPLIDTTLEHYLEERALAIAYDKVATPEQSAQVLYQRKPTANHVLMAHAQVHAGHALGRAPGRCGV